MRKGIALVLAILFTFQLCIIFSAAENNSSLAATINSPEENGIKASGLIFGYGLSVSRRGNSTLLIVGETDCDSVVVKCGFKALKIERRLNSSSSWEEYYSYGNLYFDSNVYFISKSLSVDPGYQYRATCKHYAKKNILNIQTISNTSNIVTF